MSKFFITGGSGFLGINLIRFLLSKGHEIISYDIVPFDYPEKNMIKHIVGDIRDLDKLKKSMTGAEIIIHAAAALPLYKKEDIFTTDIDGTKNALDATVSNDIKRFIHISSTAVYGIPDHHPIFEDDKKIGVGPYGIAKVEAEKLCEEYRKKGLVVTIIRPKSFVGPERLGVFAMLYDWAKDGHNFPVLGSGNNKYQLLDVEDLCQAIYLAANAPEKEANDTYNIAAEKFTTMKGDFQAVLDKAGFEKKVIGFPAAPVIFILRILEILKLSPLYKWVYETAAKDSFVSIEKAKNRLGYKPKFSNIDALLRNYNWYLKNINNFENASGVSHRVPWKQNILSLVKKIF